MTPRRLLYTLLLAVAAPAAAQERLAVREEPGTPVVAVEVLVAAGPADEEPSKAGVAYLAARTITTPILARLDSLGAHLAVTAHKDAIGFTLIAAPDAWEEASRTLLVSLFRDPPEARWVLEERRAILAELEARASNPADAAVREADAALFGDGHPWARSTVGYPSTLEKLGVADVDAFLRANLTSTRAVVAVVGPVDGGRARSHLLGFLDPTTPLPRTSVPPLDPERRPVRRDYNSITTWVSVAYPFPPGADLEALRLLAQLAMDELSFSPSRRSVFNVRSQVVPRRNGGEIRFQLVSPPGEAEDWAERIREVVSGVAGRALLEETLAARLRRYRGERLHSLAAPEDRAGEIARHLLVDGGEARLAPDDIDLSRLRAATRALAAPVVVLLGPFLDTTG